MALITESVVIENIFDRESTELSIIAASMAVEFSVETINDANSVITPILNGLLSVPLAVEFINHNFLYDIVTTNDMLTQLIEPVSKTINEVDQVTEEKVLRPFGIALSREYWF
jgi:hypothetical protein